MRALAAFLLGLLLILGGVMGCGYELARRALGTGEFDTRFGRTLHARVPMRDGVELTTQIHLPEGAGPWPTILVRNPYNYGDWFGGICRFFVRYGYACVHQDVRGRFGSGGSWVPLLHEREDGLDTLRWLVAQPWQNSNVALFGMSYLAAVQWMVSDALPAEVKTLIPLFIASNPRSAMWERGMFRPEVFTVWAALMPGQKLNLLGGPSYQRALHHWPPLEADVAHFGRRLDWYRQWLQSSQGSASLWQLPEFQRMAAAPERANRPMLLIGGWYDLFLKGMLEDFSRLTTLSQSRCLIGPWVHLQNAESDLELPGDPGRGGQVREILAWLDQHLRNGPSRSTTGVVDTYAIGRGAWSRHATWPPPSQAIRYFLEPASGEAGGACQPGGLSLMASGRSQTLSYTYDPANPVPTLGGGGLLAFALPGYGGAAPGIQRQPAPCTRGDVLSFLSEPLPADLHLAGAPRVTLPVVSSAPDTAFTALVMEVKPDGRAYHIRDGITTLAFRTQDQVRETYVPGTRVEATLELWPIEWVLATGSRLRLDISSSNFPAYHLHPNREGEWAHQVGYDVAHQRLEVGAGTAFLELPILVSAPPAAVGPMLAAP